MQEPVREDVMEAIENLSNTYMELVEQAIDALYNSDTSLANKVIDNIDSVHLRVTELHSSILKLESHETMISLGTIVDSLSRIGDLGSNIAEIAINSAIKNK
jgi:phosphate uptake regulator